jgi:hypothetical protein
MELLLSGGDGAEEVEEVEVLKHRREGHAMNEERGVRRREANIVLGCGKGEKVCGLRLAPSIFQTTESTYTNIRTNRTPRWATTWI